MESTKSNNGESYLAFMLGKEVFAIPTSKVLEVLEIQELTQLPNAPDVLKGILNLRGDVLPVMDLRIKLSQKEIKESSKNVIIVVEVTNGDKTIKIGAIADSVKEVLEIKPDQILPSPDAVSNYNKEIIEGIYRDDKMFYMLLDINRVLSDDNLNLLQAAQQLAG